jgi:hypothetical protein
MYTCPIRISLPCLRRNMTNKIMWFAHASRRQASWRIELVTREGGVNVSQ